MGHWFVEGFIVIDFRHVISSEQLRSPRVLVGLVCAVVIGAFAVTGVSDLAVTILAPGVDPAMADRVSPEFRRHEQMAAVHKARFDGRSLFTTPLKPPSRPKPVPVVQAPTKVVTPPKPVGPPTRYEGPRPTGVMADLVFFVGGKSVKVGETGEGVTVVRIMPPDEVQLKHKGGEYTVPLRERFDDAVLTSGGGAGAHSLPPGITSTPTPTPGIPMPLPVPLPPPEQPPVVVPESGLSPSLPPELDPTAVAAMDHEQAKRALDIVADTLSRSDVDTTVKERLERDRQLLVERLNKLD